MGVIVAGIFLSVLFGILPMAIYAVILTLFDRYEKEPPLLMLGVFLWGLIVASGTAVIFNTLFGVTLFVFTNSEALSNAATAVVSAPLVEETVKGLAVLAVFLYFRNEFDSVLDGVIYGSLVGFGFAAAENISYIYRGFLGGGFAGLAVLVFVRAILIAFLHATLTAFTGIGLAIGRLSRGPMTILAPLAGYITAIVAHAFHNLLSVTGSDVLCVLGSAVNWLGFLGMFVFIIYLVWREGQVMRRHLREEVQLGNLTEKQYQAACSVSGQLSAKWGAISGGRWRQSSQFYNLCGELAFKKFQLAKLGPASERTAQETIDRLRREIAAVSAQA